MSNAFGRNLAKAQIAASTKLTTLKHLEIANEFVQVNGEPQNRSYRRFKAKQEQKRNKGEAV